MNFASAFIESNSVLVSHKSQMISCGISENFKGIRREASKGEKSPLVIPSANVFSSRGRELSFKESEANDKQ